MYFCGANVCSAMSESQSIEDRDLNVLENILGHLVICQCNKSFTSVGLRCTVCGMSFCQDCRLKGTGFCKNGGPIDFWYCQKCYANSGIPKKDS